jgi:prepilin-type N-terminal cleavage/methylation domain-containing protein
MKNSELKRVRKGFTLVEILIASGVFAIFATGLFSFYRMGSNMYVTGSWKLQKQKEAERFLSILKERVEQASNASALQGGSVASATCAFNVLESGTIIDKKDKINAAADNTRLMLFTVCKPNMEPIGSPGMVLFHCLMLVPAEKNLYTLYLHANTDPVPNDGIDYFGAVANFKPEQGDFANYANQFRGIPGAYNLGSVPYTIKLRDVKRIEMNWSIGSNPTSSNEAFRTVQLKVTLQNPTHENTTVNQQMEAKIDFTVPVMPHPPGGIK